MESEPLYPFGYGLSTTTFACGRAAPAARTVDAGAELEVSVEVRNTGKRAGDEVVQACLADLEASVRVPRWKLAAFARVASNPGESRKVTLRISARSMAVVDERGRHVVEPGRFRLYLGGRQPDTRSAALAGTEVITVEWEVCGRSLVLPM